MKIHKDLNAENRQLINKYPMGKRIMLELNINSFFKMFLPSGFLFL